jgi:hypothetical protein
MKIFKIYIYILKYIYIYMKKTKTNKKEATSLFINKKKNERHYLFPTCDEIIETKIKN